MTLVSLILIPASYLYWKTGKKQLVWPMDLSKVFVPGSDTVRHPSQISVAFTNHRVASLAQNESPTLEINN